MNHHFGKNLSLCLFESCSHQEFSRILHFSPSSTMTYWSNAVNSGHKLATTMRRMLQSNLLNAWFPQRLLWISKVIAESAKAANEGPVTQHNFRKFLQALHIALKGGAGQKLRAPGILIGLSKRPAMLGCPMTAMPAIGPLVNLPSIAASVKG